MRPIHTDKPVTVFDFETYLFADGYAAPRIVCGAFFSPYHDQAGVFEPSVLFAREDALDALEKALQTPDMIFINQEIAFDFLAACALRPQLIPLVFAAYRDGRVRDTKIRQQLIDIEAGILNYRKGLPKGVKSAYSLAGLEWIHFQRDRSAEKAADSWRLRYAELEGIPVSEYPAAASEYPLKDVLGAYDVFRAQAVSESDPYAPLVNEVEQVRKAWALKLASCWGMRTDGVSVEQLEQEITAKYLELQTAFAKLGLFVVKKCLNVKQDDGTYKMQRADDIPRDLLLELKVDAKLLKAFDEGKPLRFSQNKEAIRKRVVEAYATLGIAPKTTPSGEISTDADTLEQSGDDILAELGGAGPVGTIRNTFLPTLRLGTQVPINTEYRELLTSGRISSAKPNLNNIPRNGGVRECFTARPGFVYCSTDYNCAELRGLGQVQLWLFGESEMAKFFQDNPNGDPHLELAASIMGISYAEAKARLKAGDKYVKGMRQTCKALNFGLPGGLGIDTLIATARKQYNVIFTRDEAQMRKDQWMQRWKMKQYFAHINSKVGLGNATIMQLRPGGLPHRKRGNVGYCDGANTYFQGLIADAAAEGLADLSEECYTDESSPLFGSRPVAFLYDEVICEIPLGPNTHEAAYRQAEVFVAGARKWVPDIPMISEPALMRRWSKDAEAKFDGEGRLIPWDDERQTA